MLHRYGCQEKGNQTRTRSRPIAGQKAKTMRLSKLRKKTLKQAKRERRRGSLTQEQYRACIAVVEDHAALVELNERVERDVNPWNRADGLIGADWSTWLSNLWDWFVENWPAILKVIMTIAPLLLLEPQNEDR